MYTIDSLLSLSICLTLHFICYLVGWNVCCIITLIGVYFSTLQVYVAILEAKPVLVETLIPMDSESEQKNPLSEQYGQHTAEDEGDSAQQEDEDDSAQHEDEHEAEGEDEDEDEAEYADMPDLIPLDAPVEQNTKVYSQLQNVVDETNARNEFRRLNDTGEQIKQALTDLQQMIDVARKQASAPLVTAPLVTAPLAEYDTVD